MYPLYHFFSAKQFSFVPKLFSFFNCGPYSNPNLHFSPQTLFFKVSIFEFRERERREKVVENREK